MCGNCFKQVGDQLDSGSVTCVESASNRKGTSQTVGQWYLWKLLQTDRVPVRQWVWDMCGKCFKQVGDQSVVLWHVWKVLQTGRGPGRQCVCDICVMCFKQVGDQLDNRQWVCDMCGKCFKQAGDQSTWNHRPYVVVTNEKLNLNCELLQTSHEIWIDHVTIQFGEGVSYIIWSGRKGYHHNLFLGQGGVRHNSIGREGGMKNVSDPFISMIKYIFYWKAQSGQSMSGWCVDIITRTGEGGIPCGDHVNCFV